MSTRLDHLVWPSHGKQLQAQRRAPASDGGMQTHTHKQIAIDLHCATSAIALFAKSAGMPSLVLAGETRLIGDSLCRRSQCGGTLVQAGCAQDKLTAMRLGRNAFQRRLAVALDSRLGTQGVRVTAQEFQAA